MIINYINAAVFGVVQGLTEFLPVSSSGHLVILHEFISLPFPDALTFDVVLHLATLLSVIWFFRQDIGRLVVGFKQSFNSGRKAANNPYSKLSWLIILATVPAVLAGFWAEDFIESSLRSLGVTITMLIALGALFIIAEKFSRRFLDWDSLNWKKSLFIGLAQALALIPGTSRSGITIIAGLAVGLKREAAIRFSFLLSIPAVAGATAKKLPQVFRADLTSTEAIVLLIAFLFSAVSAVFTIKYFLRFARKRSLNIFAYYRFALAALIILLLVL